MRFFLLTVWVLFAGPVLRADEVPDPPKPPSPISLGKESPKLTEMTLDLSAIDRKDIPLPFRGGPVAIGPTMSAPTAESGRLATNPVEVQWSTATQPTGMSVPAVMHGGFMRTNRMFCST